jgi:hypothetical protein
MQKIFGCWTAFNDWLKNLLKYTTYRLLYRLRMDPTDKTAFIVREACFPSRYLAVEVYSCGSDHLENTSTLLLTARLCRTVYRAVVRQRRNQIRYRILVVKFLRVTHDCVHCITERWGQTLGTSPTYRNKKKDHNMKYSETFNLWVTAERIL